MSEQTGQRTPGEWRYAGDGIIAVWGAGATDDYREIAEVFGTDELNFRPLAPEPPAAKANAEFIVRAVKSHNGLVEALKVMADHAGETYPHFESERGQRDIAAAREALAKAEEQDVLCPACGGQGCKVTDRGVTDQICPRCEGYGITKADP